MVQSSHSIHLYLTFYIYFLNKTVTSFGPGTFMFRLNAYSPCVCVFVISQLFPSYTPKSDQSRYHAEDTCFHLNPVIFR